MGYWTSSEYKTALQGVAKQMTNDELISALEKATGPDRWIDNEIAKLIGLEMPSDCAGWPAEFTHSIDAALTLVPEGWSYNIGKNEIGTNAQVVLGRSHPTNSNVFLEGTHIAIVICIAALKARGARR